MAYLKLMLAELPEKDRARFDLRILPVGPLSGFESLEVQGSVIDTTEQLNKLSPLRTSPLRSGPGLPMPQ